MTRIATMLALIGFLSPTAEVGTKVEVVHVKTTRVEGGFLYTGQILVKATGRPADRGYVYLVKQSTGELVAEAEVHAEDGTFRIIGDRPSYQLMIASKRITQRTARVSEIPLFRSLRDSIRAMLPPQKYGRSALLLRPEAYIVIGHTATLYVDRHFDYTSDHVLHGETYVCEEAAAAVRHYLKRFPMIPEVIFSHTRIPFTYPTGQEGTLSHLIVTASYSDGDRVAHWFIDATPLKVGQPDIDRYTVGRGDYDLAFLHAVEDSISLSPSVPMGVFDDRYYVLAGILTRDGEVVFDYSIHEFVSATDTTSFAIVGSYGQQIAVPRWRFQAFREIVSRMTEDQFMQLGRDGVPYWAEVVRTGEVGGPMHRVYRDTFPLVRRMILKSELEEDVPWPGGP